MANLDQILFETSLGWGKYCIRFGGRSDENFGFHGNQKLSLTYNGENVVRSITTSFLIGASVRLAGNEDIHKNSDTFDFGPRSDYSLTRP